MASRALRIPGTLGLLRAARTPKPAPRRRRGAEIPLEVELSFSAGLLATTAGAGFFLQNLSKTDGWASLWQFYFATGVVTVIEVFDMALLLHLLYRGAWLASVLYSRNAPEAWAPEDAPVRNYRDSIAELERLCHSVFYFAFYFLFQGLAVLVLALGCLWFGDSDSPVLRTAGLVMVLGFGIALLLRTPNALARFAPFKAWRDRLEQREEALVRFFGMWWVPPPPERLARRSWRYGLVSIVVGLGLFQVNMGFAIVPEVALDKEVYRKSEDGFAVLRYRHGGVLTPEPPGVDDWDLDSPQKPVVPFRRLGHGHFVAAIPLADLAPGVHHVRFRSRLYLTAAQGFPLGPEADAYLGKSFLLVE